MWSFSKNKIKFIDGSIKALKKDEPLYDAWERSNMMVLPWIIKTLSQQIAESVVCVENARDLWEELKEKFSKGDYFKISYMLQEIHSIHQGDRNITIFYRLKEWWQELESLRPIPHCSCDILCKRDMSRNSIKYKEIEYVICFLKRLNDTYNHVHAQILLMEPLLTINRAFPLIIQQERHNNGNLGYNSESKVVVNVVEK